MTRAMKHALRSLLFDAKAEVTKLELEFDHPEDRQALHGFFCSLEKISRRLEGKDVLEDRPVEKPPMVERRPPTHRPQPSIHLSGEGYEKE